MTDDENSDSQRRSRTSAAEGTKGAATEKQLQPSSSSSSAAAVTALSTPGAETTATGGKTAAASRKTPAPHDKEIVMDQTNLSSVAAASSPPSHASSSSSADKQHLRRLALYGSRAMAAGGKKGPAAAADPHGSAHGRHALTAFGARRSGELASYIQHGGDLTSQGRYLVVGDGLMAPFMALCLRVHGLECDLAHHPSQNDLDRGTVVLTPSVTQLMGDVLNVSVPSGSVVGRVLTFDHVGNDMCDIDLNEFREKGESPTFFCCDRLKVESALVSLCRIGAHSCTVLPKPQIDKGGLEALENGGVRVRFASGVQQDYLGVICTARNQDLVPELTITNEELQARAENTEKYRSTFSKSVRWMELCVPPLPELGKFEKRFTPGSQEIVEILTPRDAKMTVRPTMMATKLFYNVTLTIPDGTADPRLKSTSTKLFWDDVVMHWTSGVPGYISHTMFRPMFTHLQQNFTKSSALVYRTPLFLMPHWSEGGGRVIKVAHAAHGSCFDAVDVSDAQGFTDCFTLARTVAGGEDVAAFLKERRLLVMEEMDHHSRLTYYGLKERGQMAYMMSRFNMKIMRKYKKSWRSILQNYITLMPKGIPR
ncbi:conserved hypothetical protein [Leishmania braziliensis MHOM/BR/75/M2904]|uniref:Uncharacterized protein n=1 Tax=Leishmania braziliensis TaxID=5660 RepID=A4H4L5_LEIBR|nr:conserved hypothetical protein [Leishmania braziliensis MHOM/BR/75/M2904]KAI5689995.1 hypothetical protein MNV84_00704 [Leishmania braziliensis]CAJ2466593.1 unnamed protein product [Leishmania braziliensis]CAM37008.1 conserved hypothetical protein [Leishmania braziliensis MHOM/BR/75/M2904]